MRGGPEPPRSSFPEGATLDTLDLAIRLAHGAGLLLAAAAAVLYVALLTRGAGGTTALRRGLLWSAWATMSVALLLRTAQLGTIPLLTPLEALYFYAWLVFGIYLVLMRSHSQATVGSLLVPLGTMCAAVSVLGHAAEPAVNPIFRNPLFAAHAVSAFLGYSALSIACCAGILYLVLHDRLTRRKFGPLFERLPPLEDLDRLGHRTVVLGFALLTVAIGTGAVWARIEWGVGWIWEPKAVWSLLTWFVYGGYLVARRGAGWRGLRAAWLATAGFAVSVVAFLGSNYLVGPGRHVFQ